MRREGHPDPGISLGGQSAVVNKSEARVKYEHRAKSLIESFKAKQASCRERRAAINLRLSANAFSRALSLWFVSDRLLPAILPGHADSALAR